MKINFRKTNFWGVAADMNSCPPSDRPELVLSGKSNVGKSTLLNALVDNKKMARVSQAPGKTRLVVYFDVDQKIYIADLPGYGFAKAPKDVHVGDELVTSGSGGLFPAGIPIGVIVSVDDSSELTRYATLKPYTDISSLNDVFVMVPNARTAVTATPAPTPAS